VRAIAIVTMTSALLTYLAVKQDQSAVTADRIAVLQTAEVQHRQVPAEVQVHAENLAATRYRRLLAEADALDQRAAALTASGRQVEAARWADDAVTLRALADNISHLTFDVRGLDGNTAAARFDSERRLQTILGFGQADSVPPDQPGATAGSADRHRALSQWTVACVAGLLGVLVLLTLARLARATWRPWLLGIAAAGYVLGTVAGLVNALRDVSVG
jgi:hypothetical protein